SALTLSGGGTRLAFRLSGLDRAVLNGGPGDNVLNAAGFTGRAVLYGRAGDDTLIGGPRHHRLDGRPGGRRRTRNRGNDFLNGGPGNDRLVEAGNVNFTLTNTGLTGLGSDALAGIEEASLTGGVGDNVLDASAFTGVVELSGGAGNDVLRGGSN